MKSNEQKQIDSLQHKNMAKDCFQFIRCDQITENKNKNDEKEAQKNLENIKQTQEKN